MLLQLGLEFVFSMSITFTISGFNVKCFAVLLFLIIIQFCFFAVPVVTAEFSVLVKW